jgi:hypothetical protein
MRSVTPFLILFIALLLDAAGCGGLRSGASNGEIELGDAEPCSVMMNAPFSAVAGSYTNGAAATGTCRASTAGDTLAVLVRAGEEGALLRLPLAGVVVNQPTSVEELAVSLGGSECASWDGLVDLSQPLPGWRIWIELGCRDNPELKLHLSAQQGSDRPYQ